MSRAETDSIQGTDSRKLNMQCDEAFKMVSQKTFPSCENLVEVSNPLCKHEIKIPCHVAAEVKEWVPWTTRTEGVLKEESFFLRVA